MGSLLGRQAAIFSPELADSCACHWPQEAVDKGFRLGEGGRTGFVQLADCQDALEFSRERGGEALIVERVGL